MANACKSCGPDGGRWLSELRSAAVQDRLKLRAARVILGGMACAKWPALATDHTIRCGLCEELAIEVISGASRGEAHFDVLLLTDDASLKPGAPAPPGLPADTQPGKAPSCKACNGLLLSPGHFTRCPVVRAAANMSRDHTHVPPSSGPW